MYKKRLLSEVEVPTVEVPSPMPVVQVSVVEVEVPVVEVEVPVVEGDEAELVNENGDPVSERLPNCERFVTISLPAALKVELNKQTPKAFDGMFEVSTKRWMKFVEFVISGRDDATALQAKLLQTKKLTTH